MILQVISQMLMHLKFVRKAEGACWHCLVSSENVELVALASELD